MAKKIDPESPVSRILPDQPPDPDMAWAQVRSALIQMESRLEDVPALREILQRLVSGVDRVLREEERRLRRAEIARLERRVQMWTALAAFIESPVTQHLLRGFLTVLLYGAAQACGLPVTPDLFYGWLKASSP